MRAWTAVTVDDEAPALKRLRDLLRGVEGVELAGEFSDPAEALEALRRDPPDILFLDVQMPGMTGFDLLRALGRPPSVVIFVTAYDQHALEAFEVHAFDYLLKPVARDRFAEAVARARQRLESDAGGDLPARLAALLGAADGRRATVSAPAPAARIPLRAGERFVMVDPAEIDRVEVDGNLVRVSAGGERYVFRETLAAFEARLPPGRFVRVHRSLVVNLDRVRQVEPWFHGDYLLVMADGSKIVTGATYRDRVRAALGLP
ncbi:MAG TPA: LytTR family DNA-binding domain-containing protein [Longimicrobiaceae bacterium]